MAFGSGATELTIFRRLTGCRPGTSKSVKTHSCGTHREGINVIVLVLSQCEPSIIARDGGHDASSTGSSQAPARLAIAETATPLARARSTAACSLWLQIVQRCFTIVFLSLSARQSFQKPLMRSGAKAV